jgi:hypothetical protein
VLSILWLFVRMYPRVCELCCWEYEALGDICLWWYVLLTNRSHIYVCEVRMTMAVRIHTFVHRRAWEAYGRQQGTLGK